MAHEGPSRPPVQRPSPVDAVAAPVPVEPELWRLPTYDAPIATSDPSPKRSRHRKSEAMMATGSVVLGLGATAMLFGLGSWYVNSRNPWYHSQIPWMIPSLEVGAGLVFATIGSAFLGVGVKQHKRWKANRAEAPARVQLQPMIGFTQIGVVGRF